MTEEEVRDAAMAWARQNKKAFAREFTSLDRHPSEREPVSVFMAGSPGAGKTETSKALEKELSNSFLRIDPDDFRHQLPGYTGSNSWLFQGAVSVLLGCVLDHAFKQGQSFLLDGTLSSYEQAEQNVSRSLSKGRAVLIMYVHQEPGQAWEFVKAREALEGRKIPEERFVEQYFAAHDVVSRLKVKFGSQVTIDVILKDIDGKDRRYLANVADLRAALPIPYTREQVTKIVGL